MSQNPKVGYCLFTHPPPHSPSLFQWKYTAATRPRFTTLTAASPPSICHKTEIKYLGVFPVTTEINLSWIIHT